MIGDWLQGPYVYAVYKSYGFDLNQQAILFVTGFLSSGIFGTIVGSAADKYGRKKFCLLFALLYSASCFIVLSKDFYILLMGRILSGISTSLLFSVFESWMVSEHFSRGFSPSLLSETFSQAIYGNGLVAIFSGLLANWLVKQFGVTSPFLAAIGFFALASLVITFTWKENYGSKSDKDDATEASSLSRALKVISNDSRVLAVGAVQSLFEASMYTFVFFWGPFLEIHHKSEEAIMIGSLIYKNLSGPRNVPLSDIAQITFLVAGVSLLIPLLYPNETTLFCFFTLFEMTCGLYFPTVGTLRAKVVPENLRATISNLFRVPLNMFVVALLVTDLKISTRCLLCSVLLIIAFVWSFALPEVNNL
ncbi:3641_t:CDS:10 [Funneliformis geosporum]|uniref:Molybdate-anion transporter n=1 Tax=Funneliformis geosporum TaxID=1117311 RepID=A0A9W4SEH3_9GLOM|nr:7495_t:CDS:10 [Funneliformis geosporum]CAI2177368.1 3641_t:CDS:10 [Funneliformis geosporum]